VFSPDGRRVVTASDDQTARIWNADAPALDSQIKWLEAAQFDPLPSTERILLGLPHPPDVRQWSVDRTKCDESAAAPYDPDRRAPGLMVVQIVPAIAAGVCEIDHGSAWNRARSVYQHGRVMMASGNFTAAKRDFEAAIARGYRSAQIELAMLLSRPSAGMLDLLRSIPLYERAWHDGVTIAAFELGHLYEEGVGGDGAARDRRLAPNKVQAEFWYQRAADANEPNALARVAEQEGVAALSAESAAEKNSHLLESFKYYAAAAEVARSEDWPDDAWRDWRYRRASLARLLEREGMMQQVADGYLRDRNRHVPPPPKIWQRLRSLFGMHNQARDYEFNATVRNSPTTGTPVAPLAR